mgnify:CR=1 FL=1
MKEILIVEDDRTIAMGIEHALNGEGFSSYICYDFASAREAILTRDFLLLLLDVNLPDGNGFELCKLARSRGDTPVIFLTVCDDEVNTIMEKRTCRLLRPCQPPKRGKNSSFGLEK